METRARHFVVGIFMLTLVLGAVGFVLWLSAFAAQIRYEPYFVRFAGSVSQLRSDSTVLFGGIPIGRVIDVGIDPENSELARVSIEIRQGTPVRTNSIASLEVQSLAGGVVMQISRGSRGADLLAPGSEIRGTPSTLERLARQIPDLLTKLDVLADKFGLFLNQENAELLSGTLENLRRLAGELANLAEGFDETLITQVLKDADSALVGVRDAADRMALLAQTLAAASAELTGGAKHATDDLSAMAQSMARSADGLARMIEENREPLRQFSGTALYEATELVAELRRLVASMARISHQIENDPARFFLGDRSKGVETP